ncbi:MAG: hypothetical protein WCQ53_04505, partial [bacterium]
LNMKKVNTSRTAEEIVISEILKQNISGKTGKEITKLMDESPMTISRALFELQQHNYCKLIQNGREKTVTLLDKNRLWVLVKNNFTTPVESTTFVKDLKNIEHYTVKAGTTALSKLGMLNEEDKAILAIYKKEYIKLLKNNKINLCNEDDARFIIEVWNISPFFCSNNGIINPISLYLSMKDEADDRIQLEIKKILEQYGLNIDG